MEEARQVLERLDRIEALGRRRAPPETVLAELRELVREAEAWARREGRPASGAAEAIETLREAVRERAPPQPREPGRSASKRGKPVVAPSED